MMWDSEVLVIEACDDTPQHRTELICIAASTMLDMVFIRTREEAINVIHPTLFIMDYSGAQNICSWFPEELDDLVRL